MLVPPHPFLPGRPLLWVRLIYDCCLCAAVLIFHHHGREMIDDDVADALGDWSFVVNCCKMDRGCLFLEE